MLSATKVPLAPDQIDALVCAAFGAGARVIACRAADSGMYNAGYHLELAGGGPVRAFLKAAPPHDLPCLTHEHGLMRAEIETLGRLAAAGVGKAPAVLFADTSHQHAPRDVVFLEHLPGALLSETQVAPEAEAGLRREIGVLARAIASVCGAAFGYPGCPALQATTWQEAFGRMLDAVLDDAARFAVDPPLEPLRRRVQALLPLLDVAAEPRLVHYDLWDGNILVVPDGAGWTISGLIDWERAFHGDPVAELVSLSFQTDPQPDPAVLHGWSGTAGFDLDPATRRRLALYRAYLWLIMLVEAGPRGFLTSQPAAKWAETRRRLERDVALAEEPLS